MKKTVKMLLTILLIMSLCASSALAFQPDETYTYNVSGKAVYSPHVYEVSDIIDVGTMGIEKPLKGAQDIYMDNQDNLYVLDTGNQRVLVLDPTFKCTHELTEFNYKGEILKLADGAMGLFYQEDQKLLYIADTKNDRIIVTDLNGNVSRVVYKPTDVLLESLTHFAPRKIVVDNMGLIFVTSVNVNTGALLINKKDEFLGYYGTNTIKKTWQVQLEYMWRGILTERQNAQSDYSFQPTEFFNITWTNDRFVFAVSPLSDTIASPVMRLNALGENTLSEVDFGDLPAGDNGMSKKPTFVDIAVDDEGVFTILDSARCRLFQYDEQCNMLGIFGGEGYQRGLFKLPTSIETDSQNRIYVLDAEKNTITVLKQTHYGERIRVATALHNEGRYEQAMEAWREIIRMNSNYDLAYVGIGKAYMKLKDYQSAMDSFKLADDQENYAEAREMLRAEWMRENFSYIAFVVVFIMLFLLLWDEIKPLLIKLDKKIRPDKYNEPKPWQKNQGKDAKKQPKDKKKAKVQEKEGGAAE